MSHAFTPQPHSVTALLPVLIFRPAEGRRLSWFEHVCAYHCVQLFYTRQHRTVLIYFLLILQTSIIVQMMSMAGMGGV